MAVSFNLDAIDLSGTHPFRISAFVMTKKKGSILCKNFPGSFWKNGGNEGQCKCLFVNKKGRLCFDIGWTGCIEGKSIKVNDGQVHTVELHFANDKYHLFVDGAHEACGLHAVPDHPKTTVRTGVDSALMKEFRGSISDITYSSDIVPPCLLRTSVSGVFGHLDRLELLSPPNANMGFFQEPNITANAGASNGMTGNRLLNAVRSLVKPQDRDAIDRDMARELKDAKASSSELGRMAYQDGKKVVRAVQSVPGKIARIPGDIARDIKEDIECTFTHLPWCNCEKCKRVNARNQYDY